MLTPDELERMPKEIEKLMSNLELELMYDIIRKIKRAGTITRATDYQIYKLYQIGESKKAIKLYIQRVLELSDKELDNLYNEVIDNGYTREKSIYRASGKKFIEYKDNPTMQQLVSAIKEQTKGEFRNITNSTGFIHLENGKTTFMPIIEYYQNTLDRAVTDIATGAFDYNTVIKRTIDEMTKSGLRTVSFSKTRTDRIEVATRRAILTGINQVVGKINEENASKLQTEHYEVSAHGTARPSHQKWQGRVYTMQELKDICGLGKVDGLCGANCRHSYSPFIIGVSKRRYTDEELEKWAEEENTPRKYGDKEYTAYEASQEQRKLERLLRKQKQDVKLLKEADASDEDINVAQARYRITSEEYAKFSKAMGLPEQRARVYPIK